MTEESMGQNGTNGGGPGLAPEVRDSLASKRTSATARRPMLLELVTAGLSAWGLMRGQLRFLRERGFDITLVSAPDEFLERAADREGVRAVGLPMLREPALTRDLTAFGRLVRLIRRLRPDIVHFSTAKAGLLGGVASWLCGVPIRLYTLRGMRLDGFHGLRARLMWAPERAACAAAERIYCVSDSLRQRALDLRLAHPEKLRVLEAGSSNGVDVARFQRTPEILRRAEELRQEIKLPPGVPVVGFVGRLVRDKGAVELLSAYRVLRQDVPRLHLLLVGPFERYDGLPAECMDEIHGDPQIITTGMLDDTASAYALADVIALPTHREGFPNVALEAAAMELPVVATRVTGCVDAVVPGVTGTLVPPREAAALADALRTYLNAPELRRRHGRAARQRAAREFRSERIWEALYREYSGLLAAKQLPMPLFEEDRSSGFSRVETTQSVDLGSVG